MLTIRKDQIHKFHRSGTSGYALLFTEEFGLSYLEMKGATQIMELFNELLFEQHTRLSPQAYGELLTLTRQIEQEFKASFDDYTASIIRNLLQVSIGKIHRVKTSESSKQEHKYIQRFLDFQKLVEAHCTKSKSFQYYAEHLHVTSKTLNTLPVRSLRNLLKRS